MAVIDCVLNIMQPSATRWRIAVEKCHKREHELLDVSPEEEGGVNFPAVTSDNCRCALFITLAQRLVR